MKRVIRVVLIVLTVMLLMPKVNAVELCSKTKLNKLRAKASAVTVNYVHHDDVEHPYFEIVVSNVQEGIEVKSKDFRIIYNKDIPTYSYYLDTREATKYEIKITVASNSVCGGQALLTKTLNIPKYNPYSKMEACIEYEEFPLCNKWYTGTIANEEEFNEKLKEYIKSLEPEKPEIPKEKGIMEKIIDFYLENKMITIPITIGIIGGIGFIIVRKIVRRKKRIKIDF